MNIGILLSAGTSSRFGSQTSKQLFVIDKKPMICYSLDSMLEILDHVIIVVNNLCYLEIAEIIKNRYLDQQSQITLVINNLNHRMESIKSGFQLITSNQQFSMCQSVMIHDVARPYITAMYIQRLLQSNQSHIYSQYCLKLTNGLALKYANIYEPVDRDQYVELCTPICIQYPELVKIMKNQPIDEFLPIVNQLGYSVNLIDGDYKHLHKITTIDDI